MIFVQDISRLQQYNKCRNEKSYCETVVSPRDVNLQGILPLEASNAYSINVYLFDCTGTILRAEVTDHFRIVFGTSIYNQRYFNLELKEWSDDFSDDCFILKTVVYNNGAKVFDKVTEMYCRRNGTEACYVAIPESDWYKITLNGFIEINCQKFIKGEGLADAGFEIIYNESTKTYQLFIPCDTTEYMSLTYVTTNVPTCLKLPILRLTTIEDSRCKVPLLDFESTFDCRDEITGAYYGDPVSLLNLTNQPNDQTVIYRNHILLEAELLDQPTELKREVNFLGKAQKSDYIALYLLNGLIPFPVWKMREIERILSGKKIFIQEVEAVFRSGTAFEKDTISCTCNWLLKAKIEDFPKTNDFNCLDSCITLCSYFVVPSGTADQPYYDDNGKLIGYTLGALLDWYRSFPGVISVSEPETGFVDCEPAAVFKVVATDFIPSFFYFGSNGINQRVYAKRDDCTNPTRLCEDFDPGCQSPAGIIISLTESVDPECEDIEIDPIVLISSDDWEDCELTPAGSWTIDPGYTAQHNPANQVRLSLVATSPDFTDPDNAYIVEQTIGYLGANCRPTTTKLLTEFNTPGVPSSMQIVIFPSGQIKVTGIITVTISEGTLNIPLITFTK